MPLLFFLLGVVGFLTGLSIGLFALLVVGIRQGDQGKRLTGKPGNSAEGLARRMLTGSRGCVSQDNEEAGR
jgi:hypothetical protein